LGSLLDMHYDCYFLEPAACQLWVRLGLRLSGRMSVLLPIVLKKSFFADGRKFSGPLVRLSRCEVRDHINYRKNDRWRSHRFYRALQRLKSPMRYICGIFGAPPFSSFSTQSANSGSRRTYSITSSARCWTDKGTSTPSAFAVFKLITSSNLVGCSTGRSAGFAPRRILST